jgi:EAL domain-containing protein (putative c-di-GMP-specific phosphodiesterase class I)
MEDHLAHALARDEIAVLYDPMVDLVSGRCAGAEAVVRWRHPTLGTRLPEQFLPIAERTGDVVWIGAHVLRTACRQLSLWPDDEGADLRVAVSVSPHQLVDPDFATMVRTILAENDLPPGRLTLQLTDLELFHPGAAALTLENLAAHGVRITIDGFGHGPVTLADLGSYPVHQIKVSGELAADKDAPPLLDMALFISRSLGIETVATGVATQAQAQALALRSAEATLAQGDLYAAPMTDSAFVAWLHTRKPIRVPSLSAPSVT